MAIIFDLETNGLLDTLTEIHCIAICDTDTGRSTSFGPTDIQDGLKELEAADILVGHNIIKFDIPAIRKVYPDVSIKAKIIDTLVLSRVIWADMRDRDKEFVKRNPEFPGKYRGSHALGAWGYRLGELKEEYDGGWDTWNQEMQDYCEQDVKVSTALWERIKSKELSKKCWELELKVAHILQEQEQYGFAFDTAAAGDLYGRLCERRSELVNVLLGLFPNWEVHTPFVPKANNKKLGYVKGEPTTKVRAVEFNPNSRDHIAHCLKTKYNWQPTEFTPEGKPRVDEIVLGKLQYPEAKLLAENFLLVKRLGQVGEGQHAWLNKVRDGRIHGSVNTNGAVTGRMTHAHPNLAQVPSTRALYGAECRALFTADPGYALVGCDADALELRCLAHYMAHFDGGDYVDVVLNGDKRTGTDTHSRNAVALGCDRDTAKTWFYAFIYGAGNKKLGNILGGSVKRGKDAKMAFFEGLPALGQLVSVVQSTAQKRGHLVGLDGRPLYIRSTHAALNTLLQSAGAVIMKEALVLLNGTLNENHLPAHFVANVHDEWQLQVKEGYEKDVGELACESIRSTEVTLKLRCPMEAQYSVGSNWADTH